MFLHPMTVNFDKKELDSRYGVYHEVVKTSKVRARFLWLRVWERQQAAERFLLFANVPGFKVFDEH